MKNESLKIFLILLFLVVSCNGPETVVTNYIHRDGTITRKIEMRIVKYTDYSESEMQVPFDSTWFLTDSIEIDEKGDTTRVFRAEKTFMNVDEINTTYRNDSGANREHERSAAFSKKFRWFSTDFRFSERIGKTMEYGYPIDEFLNEEELVFFYSPQSLIDKQLRGQDSIKYKMLKDSISKKTENWMMRSLISEWIGTMSKMTQGKGTEKMIDDLRNNEGRIYKSIFEVYNEQFDSLWNDGTILKDWIGAENAIRFKTEADSAIEYVTDQFLTPGFSSYSVQSLMPGRLTGTNGFIDSANLIMWPVSSDYFLTQPYEMWAESKVTNVWAWIVSGLFLLFVLTGIIIRTIKKG